MCREKKSKPQVFNTIDHVDLKKIMKALENTQKLSSSNSVQIEASSSPSNMEINNFEMQKEITVLKNQI